MGIGAGIGCGCQQHSQDGLNTLYGVKTGKYMLRWGTSILAALLRTFLAIITKLKSYNELTGQVGAQHFDRIVSKSQAVEISSGQDDFTLSRWFALKRSRWSP